MKYNNWKEANDYWRMVINKPFKIKGRNVMLLNYIENYYVRPNKSNYVTKIMHRFINYLDKISTEIYSCVRDLNEDRYILVYKDVYKEDLIGLNPYISITREQVIAISNFVDSYKRYNYICSNQSGLRKSVVNDLLDGIDKISSIQGVIRQHKYNITHKRKHPYSLINDNYIEYHGLSNAQYYNDYKQFSLNCLKQNIDITKTFYKFNSLKDTHHVFNKSPYYDLYTGLYNMYPF